MTSYTTKTYYEFVGKKRSFLDGAEKIACHEYQGGAWDNMKSWVKVDGAVVTDMQSLQGTMHAEQQEHGAILVSLQQGHTNHTNDIAALRTSISTVATQEITTDRLSAATKQYIEAAGGGTITNNADDEDLEVVQQNGLSVLKLKDKAYDAAAFSGLGRVYLRKNEQNLNGAKKNILNQQMLDKPNTVYIIQYEYDLNGLNINIRENCVLHFEGGRLKNGTIKGTDTYISGTLKSVFSNVTLKGSYSNLECNLSWWGVETNKGFDNSKDIQCAFNSNFHIINVSAKYYTSRPIQLPYNKVIKGRSGNNNMLTGFIANDDFKSQIVSFAERQGIPAYSQEVCGMFYHRDTTKCELHDICIDARWKADFCIEHIDLYGSVDFYNCYIKGAREVGILQYACENPIIDQLYIYNCHIGYYQSVTEYDRNNPFNFSGRVKGAANISTFKLLRCLGCNYGAILSGGSNYCLDAIETAYNSIVGLYLSRSVFQLNSYYTEGDSVCNFWINKDGTRIDSTSKEQTLQYLIDHNLDGFKPAKIDNRYGVEVYVRAPVCVENADVEMNSAFISVLPRSSKYSDSYDVLEVDKRNYSGIDCYIITKDSNLRGINNIIYVHSNNIGNPCLYAIYDMCKISYGTYKNINIEFKNQKSIAQNVNIIPPRIYSLTHFLKDYSKSGSGLVPFNIHKESFVDFDCNSLLYGHEKKELCDIMDFVEYYKNVPMFQYDGKSLLLIFSKSEFMAKFGNFSQIKIVFYFKIKKEGLYRLKSGVRFELKGTYVTGSETSPALEETFKAGYYECAYIASVNPSAEYDQVKIMLGNEVISSPNMKENILISGIYFFEVADSKMQFPIIDPYRKIGNTSQRPKYPHVGQNYKDTDLKKWIIWNGTEWENIDGSPLV